MAKRKLDYYNKLNDLHQRSGKKCNIKHEHAHVQHTMARLAVSSVQTKTSGLRNKKFWFPQGLQEKGSYHVLRGRATNLQA